MSNVVNRKIDQCTHLAGQGATLKVNCADITAFSGIPVQQANQVTALKRVMERETRNIGDPQPATREIDCGTGGIDMETTLDNREDFGAITLKSPAFRKPAVGIDDAIVLYEIGWRFRLACPRNICRACDRQAEEPSPRSLPRIAGGVGIAFGVLTAVSGGRALFGGVDMGAVVPFVLWFNFLAGFAYVIGGMLLWRAHPMAVHVALAIAIATAAVFAAFGWRVASGGGFEMRTVGAMTLRTAFWAAMAWAAWKTSRTAQRRGM